MSRSIDHSNYEAWLLDRLEGSLSPQQERLLDAFLAAHPELDPGSAELPTLDEWDARLAPADKEALKRTLPPTGAPGEPIDDFLIARMEGDLDPAQQAALRKYLKEHPDYRRKERLYERVKLAPGPVAFPDRQVLHRQLPPEGMPVGQHLDDFLVARLEGDLSPDQDEALTRLLDKDAQAAEEWRRLQRIKLPAAFIACPDKHALYKGGMVVAWRAAMAPWMAPLRRAAAVALLLGLAWWILLPSDDGKGQVAEVPVTEPKAVVQHLGPAEPEQAEAMQQRAGQEEVKAPASPQQASPNRIAPHAAQHYASGQYREPSPSVIRELVAQRPVSQVQDVIHPIQEEQHVPVASIEEQVLPNVVPVATPSAEASPVEGIPVGTYLANTVRSRLLAPGSRNDGPLGGEDALALVDMGLRTVAGGQAGLEVARDPEGRMRKFELRLGRNLAVTAHR